jgi:YD repeat-containing protein
MTEQIDPQGKTVAYAYDTTGALTDLTLPGGDTVGYLDLALGCNLFWFKTLREMFNVELIDEGRTPLLASWAKRFGEAAAVKDVVPNVDKAVEHAKKMRRVFVH